MDRISKGNLCISYLAPLTLWILLWLSLQPSSLSDLLNLRTLMSTVNGFRSLLPLVATVMALVLFSFAVKGYKISLRSLFAPLVLFIVYGVIGIASVFLSPDFKTSLQWTIYYLSVPLVLYALSMTDKSLMRIVGIIRLNMVLIFLATIFLFIVSLVYLEFGSLLMRPWDLIACEKPGSWFVQTGGYIRSTGVGRFAALTALISLSLVCFRHIRIPALMLLGGSIVLLLGTGARTSIVCLVVSVVFFLLLIGGRKAAIWGGIGLAIFIPLSFGTGISQTFLNNCILKGYDVSGLVYLKTFAIDGTYIKGIDSFDIDAAGGIGSLEVDIVHEKMSTGLESLEHRGDGSHLEDVDKSTKSFDKQTSQYDFVSSDPSKQEILSNKIDVLHDKTSVATSDDTPLVSDVPVKNRTTKIISDLDVTLDSRVSQDSLVSDLSAKSPPTEASAKETTSEPAVVGQNISARATNPNEINGAAVVGQNISATATNPNQINKAAGVGQNISATATNPNEISGAAGVDENRLGPVELSPVVNQEPKPPVFWFTNMINSIFPTGFFQLSGRSEIWRIGWEFTKYSPWLGYGFHGDRLVVGLHMHNAVMHALIQTGVIGTVAFVSGLIYAWVLVVKLLRIVKILPDNQKYLLYQSAAVFLFFSIRGITESTGAYFGVDWLILCPYLVYIQLASSTLRVSAKEG